MYIILPQLCIVFYFNEINVLQTNIQHKIIYLFCCVHIFFNKMYLFYFMCFVICQFPTYLLFRGFPFHGETLPSQQQIPAEPVLLFFNENQLFQMWLDLSYLLSRVIDLSLLYYHVWQSRLTRCEYKTKHKCHEVILKYLVQANVRTM